MSIKNPRREQQVGPPASRPAHGPRIEFGGLLSRFTFGVAAPHHRRQALDLRTRIYRDTLAEAGLDEYDAVAHQLVAIADNGEVAAALRVVTQENRPFDFEKILSLSRIAPPDRVVAEVSRFCVDTPYRELRRNQFVHLGLFALLVSFCRDRGINYLVSLALPHLVNLYRLAYFESFGQQLVHPTWGCVQPIILDLDALSDRTRRRPSKIAGFLQSALLRTND